ncbi:MAG TPA: hypothetical protein VMU09_09525 [Acidimicrobiales bacterium]|nr:hypothetical protein [Acidimicrobiales bacterium]
METTEDQGVAVVGGAKPSRVGPGARARGKARTVTTTRRVETEADETAFGTAGTWEAADADDPDADADADDHDTDVDRSPPRPRRAPRATVVRATGGEGRRVPLWVAIVLGAVAVVTTVLALAFGSMWSSLNAQQSAANDAKAEASRFLVALTNFRPNTVDADFSSIAAMATGDFAKQSASFFGTNIRSALQQARAQSDGQIRNIYVQKVDSNQAVVYAVVDQTYANSKTAVPATDVLRVELSLTQTDQGWKVSEVSVLQAPSAAGTPGSSASSAVPQG